MFNYDTVTDCQYHAGGSKTIEPWSFGSLTNDQGPPWEPPSIYDKDKKFKGALNRFVVLRNNVVKSNGGLVIRGTSANVVAEGNEIQLSDVGVYYNATTTQGGIVLVRNIEPNDVPNNYNPYTEEIDHT